METTRAYTAAESLTDHQPDEHELIVRASDDDKEAFGELYTLHVSDVQRKARSSVDWAAAEDVAQEAFMRMYQRIGRFEDQGKGIGPYVGRTAKNLCVDRARRMQREPQVTSNEEQQDAAFAKLFASDNTEQQALDNLQPFSQPMQEALGQLADDHQGQLEAVIAVDVEGKTYEEYSQESGVSMGTVRSRLHRGREKLRETYIRQQDINR